MTILSASSNHNGPDTTATTANNSCMTHKFVTKHICIGRRQSGKSLTYIPALVFVALLPAAASAYSIAWPEDSVEAEYETSKYGWLGLLAFFPLALLCVGGIWLRKSAWCKTNFPNLYVRNMPYTSRVKDVRLQLQKAAANSKVSVPIWDQMAPDEAPVSTSSRYVGSLDSRELDMDEMVLNVEVSAEGDKSRELTGTLEWKWTADKSGFGAFARTCPILEGMIARDGSAYVMVDTTDLRNKLAIRASQVLFQGSFEVESDNIPDEHSIVFKGLIFFLASRMILI